MCALARARTPNARDYRMCAQSRSAWGTFVATAARPPVGDPKTVTAKMRASVEIVAIDMAARGRDREGYNKALALSRNAGKVRGTCQVEAALDLAPSIIDGIKHQYGDRDAEIDGGICRFDLLRFVNGFGGVLVGLESDVARVGILMGLLVQG